MKYFLIAGEASGDLHSSRLMAALKRYDDEAQFMFIGGDKMAAEGGSLINHYSNLAYMGFVPVLLHLHYIMANMRRCKRKIVEWKPDAVILVDYPGFNLNIAKFLKAKTSIPVYYYISPKIWAWKEYRIKNIKRDITELFSILPFEVEFYERKHGYPIHYVGNPTVEEVEDFKKSYDGAFHDFGKPIIALLAGSRKQEIKDNLPAMIEAAKSFANDYQLVLAAAPSIPAEYYDKFIANKPINVVYNETFPLLAHATAALVTSGTATLETALFNVPQVVCYETPIPKVIAFLRRHLIKVKYISLVNLIANREIVKELVADTFSVENIRKELAAILPNGGQRNAQIAGYHDMAVRLGNEKAPENAAKLMTYLLKEQKNNTSIK